VYLQAIFGALTFGMQIKIDTSAATLLDHCALGITEANALVPILN